eukprot:10919340-Heterocapsa_arctica.AAC.1
MMSDGTFGRKKQCEVVQTEPTDGPNCLSSGHLSVYGSKWYGQISTDGPDSKWYGQISDLLASEQAILTAIWKPGPTGSAPVQTSTGDNGGLSAITPAMMKDAASRFPIKTAETYDGFH